MTRKILTIDDDESILKLLRAFLKNKYEIQSAMNGEEGLRILETFQPDLILLDIQMPVMDGPTFRKRLLEDPRLRDIPVMYLTADDQFNDKVDHKFGIDFLNKPIEKEDLLYVLESFFDSQPS